MPGYCWFPPTNPHTLHASPQLTCSPLMPFPLILAGGI